MSGPASSGLAPKSWAGYRAHSRARSTGALVVLVEAEAQGLDADEGGRWALVCDDHGSILQDSNQRRIRGWMAEPEGWCSDCGELVP